MPVLVSVYVAIRCVENIKEKKGFRRSSDVVKISFRLIVIDHEVRFDSFPFPRFVARRFLVSRQQSATSYGAVHLSSQGQKGNKGNETKGKSDKRTKAT